MSAEPNFVDHEVELILVVTMTRDDVQDALTRSGIYCGAVIGEALVESVAVYSPDPDDPS